MKNKNTAKNKNYLYVIGTIFLIALIVLIIYLIIKQVQKDDEDENNTTAETPVNPPKSSFKLRTRANLKNNYLALSKNGLFLGILNGSKVTVKKIESDYSLTDIGQQFTISNFLPESIQISEDGNRILTETNPRGFTVYSFDGTDWLPLEITEYVLDERRENGAIRLADDGNAVCYIQPTGENNGIICREITNIDVPGDGIYVIKTGYIFREYLTVQGTDLSDPPPQYYDPTILALSLDLNKAAYVSKLNKEVYLFNTSSFDPAQFVQNAIVFENSNIKPKEVMFSPDANYLGVLWDNEIEVYNVETSFKATRILKKNSFGQGLSNIYMSNNVIAFTNDNNQTYQQEFTGEEKVISYKGNRQSLLKSDSSIFVRSLNEDNIEIYSKEN
ncbi:MAG: hypothetical protein GY932_15415 [Arcobacter sp.]|nr:hypothetical protein [Flavobacteriaceae bacterium]MCP4971964.1 hypothetical protein [Arcobacter sp.]